MKKATLGIIACTALLVASACRSGGAESDTGPDFEESSENDSNNDQYNTRPAGDTSNPADTSFDSCTPVLTAIVRDFPDSHPDFHHPGEEGKAGEDLVEGMVQIDLDADGKPVRGANDFFSEHLSKWYRTIDGVNREYVSTITLSDAGGGIWTHNNDSFFPLGPNQGYGHENNVDGNGELRNFLFTTELRLMFTYETGQRFRFKGDDDLWVFINGKLAIDLGGIHSQREQEIDIDAHAAKYNMTPGFQYTMHIFHAERNPVESHFRIDTNIECFTGVPVV